MKLFLLSQKERFGYDTFDDIVVAANVKVKYIGEAGEGIESGIILASFNAG